MARRPHEVDFQTLLVPEAIQLARPSRAASGAAGRPGVFAGRGFAILVPRRPMKFTRITTRPDVCTGKPCVRDLRFPVSRLLGLLAAGQNRDEILRAYPYLEAADIDEVLRYAASLAEDEIIELIG